MALKPHLFLVVWPVILIDCILRKSVKILAFAFVLLAAVTALAYSLDSHAWSQYAAMLHTAQLSSEFLQTPAYLLRWLIAPNQLWVQLVPSAIAVLWASWYYWQHRSDWDWLRHGAVLVLVSVIVSPYAWLTDELVFLPAVIGILASKTATKAVTVTYLAINVVTLVLLLTGFQLSSGVYIWTPLAWGVWYLYSNRAIAARCPERLEVS